MDGKISQIMKFTHTPSSHVQPFLSTIEQLGKIRLHMAFAHEFFEQTKTNLF